MTADAVRLDAADRAKLRRAVALLESSSFVMTLAGAAGRPATALLATLPNFASDAIDTISRKIILQCLHLALRPRRSSSLLAIATRYPRLTTGIAGAIGGLAGLPGTAVELPVTTVVMFQSIARIAAQEGEDLASPAARLACLEVFALGARPAGARNADYYAARSDLARSLDDASGYVLRRAISKKTSPALMRFASAVAARFGLLVSERLAASAIPIIGAATGASLNVALLQHLDNIARGHFAVRALERKYGGTEVQRQFAQVRLRLRQQAITGGQKLVPNR